MCELVAVLTGGQWLVCELIAVLSGLCELVAVLFGCLVESQLGIVRLNSPFFRH